MQTAHFLVFTSFLSCHLWFDSGALLPSDLQWQGNRMFTCNIRRIPAAIPNACSIKGIRHIRWGKKFQETSIH